jgi:hypothetical protein
MPSETYLFADEPPPKAKPQQQTSPLLEDLLDWLLNQWTGPNVTARDVYRHGPSPLRNDKETTLGLTEILVRQGWLIPLKTWRKDKREWKIARGQMTVCTTSTVTTVTHHHDAGTVSPETAA